MGWQDKLREQEALERIAETYGKIPRERLSIEKKIISYNLEDKEERINRALDREIQKIGLKKYRNPGVIGRVAGGIYFHEDKKYQCTIYLHAYGNRYAYGDLELELSFRHNNKFLGKRPISEKKLQAVLSHAKAEYRAHGDSVYYCCCPVEFNEGTHVLNLFTLSDVKKEMVFSEIISTLKLFDERLSK
jgi:hypothetical protein